MPYNEEHQGTLGDVQEAARSFQVSRAHTDLRPGKEPVDACIVYVRNRNNRKDWIALISTNVSLSEEDIISEHLRRSL